MAKYQVAIVECPRNWQPAAPDAVPAECGPLGDVITQVESLHDALQEAVAYNEQPENAAACRWAVVLDPDSPGRRWPNARLCTPIDYQVLTIWWPEGWEPSGADAVPNCAWQTEFDQIEPPPLEKGMTRDEALSTVLALNRQVIDHAADRWYVAAVVENEPLPPQATEPAAGDFETRRIYILKPGSGSPRGDCSACPARELDCTTADRQGQPCTLTVARTEP